MLLQHKLHESFPLSVLGHTIAHFVGALRCNVRLVEQTLLFPVQEATCVRKCQNTHIMAMQIAATVSLFMFCGPCYFTCLQVG